MRKISSIAMIVVQFYQMESRIIHFNHLIIDDFWQVLVFGLILLHLLRKQRILGIITILLQVI